MLSGTTRKLLEFDEDTGPDKTRRRIQIGIQLPPPQSLSPSQPPVINPNQDSVSVSVSHLASEQTMFVYIQPPLPPPPPVTRNQDSDPETELTMYSYHQNPPPVLEPQPQLPVLEPPNDHDQNPPHAPRRNRRKPTHAPGQGKSQIIEPPFPWATRSRAKVHSMKHLTETLKIKTISGEVECKRCQKTYNLEYNLEHKYKEINDYVEMHVYDFRDRAPVNWMSPALPKCRFCNQENSMKPVMKKKKMINWLFLFLGQMLGCCTLEQLKYFCKHTGNHRTGAKDRVLFLTYLELFRQVDPERWADSSKKTG